LQDFIEAEFLEEQVEGVKRLSDLLRRLERVSCDGLGLHTIDNELLLQYTK
jgi:ferritin